MKYYSIVKEAQFEKQFSEIEPDQKRADSLLVGLEWVLTRCPRAGKQVAPGSSVWALPMTEYATDDEPLVLYYTFDDDQVYLLKLVKSPDFSQSQRIEDAEVPF